MKYVKSVRNSFHLTSVTESELFNIIYSLASKSSFGFDSLSTKNLKLIYPYVAAVLLKIINKSFESGIFSDILKIARVIALYKGGDVDQLVNFRPISLFCSLFKVFERAMFNRMLSFINKHDSLSNSQFGFRSNNNTELAILHADDFILKLLDAKVYVISLYIDLSKVFDSFDHKILLDKLFLIGVRGIYHLWLSSYLRNRF